MELILNTIRMVDYDQAREYALGDENSLKEKLALGLVNPEDYKKLNLTSSLNIELSNKYGRVIIKAKQDENVPPGIILLPVSIWVNQITGYENGELIFKNIKVNVSVSSEPIKGVHEIINSIKN